MLKSQITKDQLYPATFTKKEVISAGATVSLVAGQYTPIGTYTIKSDEAVGLGRGAYSSQSEAIGHLYAAFYDNSGTPVAITAGKLRIMLLSSQDMPIGSKPVYLDVDLAALLTGATVPADRFALPFDGTLLSEDRKIQFLIKADSAATLSQANSTVYLDVTRALQ